MQGKAGDEVVEGGLRKLKRLRIPFFGLALSAIAGIFLSSLCLLPCWTLLLFAGAAITVAFVRPTTLGTLLATFFTFAIIHTWQGPESPAVRLLAYSEKNVTVTGLVVSEPTPSRFESTRLTVRVDSMTVEGRTIHPGSQVLVNWQGKSPVCGDTIRASGRLTPLPPPRNPGQFDAKRWMALNGIQQEVTLFSPSDGTIVALPPAWSPTALASRTGKWMQRILGEGISNSPEIANVIAAITLGTTTSMTEHQKEDFRGTGTYHLFSVSGLHVGMIAVLLWQGLKLFGFRRRQAALVIIPALFFYALITGWKPASVRATIMGAIVLAGFLTSRKPIHFNSLCAAAVVILLQDTNQLFNPGFQLSFFVVAAIMLLAGTIYEGIWGIVRPDPFIPASIWNLHERLLASSGKTIGSTAAVSIAAWVGSLPLIVAYFHMVSLSALPSNLFAVPLAFLCMALAMLSLCSGLFSLWVAAVFNNANWLVTKILLSMVTFLASLPGSYFYLRMPDGHSTPKIVVYDFEAGGASLLEVGTKFWLLDCGSSYAFESTILPHLRSLGLRNMEGLVITHGDSSHMGGAFSLREFCPPAQIMESVLRDRSPQRKSFHALLSAQNTPKSLYRSGEEFLMDDQVTAEILYPPSGLSQPLADDKALVLRVTSGTTRILFMSDSGEFTEGWLLKNVRNHLEADILVKGQHQRTASAQDEFLSVVNPQAIICSAAPYPRSQRSDPEWLKHVSNLGIRVFSQDKTGAVTINLEPDGYKISGFVDGSTFDSRKP